MDKVKTTIVTGHYGSGKTEFCVNLALDIAKRGEKVTIADLDVVNPYFRSREAAAKLASRGITLASDHFGGNSGQDLPAASFAFLSNVRAEENVIIDLAGGKVGTRLLAACYDAIKSVPYEFLCVLNLFRPETSTAAQMIDFINTINAEVALPITGLVNNGNLLHDSTADHILSSQKAVMTAANALGLPLRYTLIHAELYKGMENMIQSDEVLLFDKLQMRESWQ